MSTERLLPVLQLADGLFPAGGFAHSFGLETYAQAGTVRDRAGLAAFVATQLEGAVGPADAVAAALAARAGRARDLGVWLALDARLESMKCVPELRTASRQMGRQTARAAVAMGEDRALARLRDAIDAEQTPGHHAVVFGAALGRRGADPETVAAAFLYATVTTLVGAALRLLSMGQLDGQRVLAGTWPAIARLAARAAATPAEDMWSFTPALEIAGIRHADLAMRLFRS